MQWALGGKDHALLADKEREGHMHGSNKVHRPESLDFCGGGGLAAVTPGPAGEMQEEGP